MIKEGIIKLMEDLLRAFQSDMASGQSGTCTLSFKDLRGCGAPDFHGVKDPIVAKRWIVEIKSAQLMSFFPEGSKVRYADIRKHVTYSACPTLDDMIAREREIDIDHIRKRKAETKQVTGVSWKKPKGFESRSMG